MAWGRVRGPLKTTGPGRVWCCLPSPSHSQVTPTLVGSLMASPTWRGCGCEWTQVQGGSPTPSTQLWFHHGHGAMVRCPPPRPNTAARELWWGDPNQALPSILPSQCGPTCAPCTASYGLWDSARRGQVQGAQDPVWQQGCPQQPAGLKDSLRRLSFPFHSPWEGLTPPSGPRLLLQCSR